MRGGARGTGPIREARPLTWVSDSSAEASITSTPVAATDESTWNSSVDLPMPGGPNRSVTEPPTTPPPITRSSSLTPVGSGRAPSVETSRSATAEGAGLPSRPGRPVHPDGRRQLSHSPQVPHRPTQRSEAVPHAVQT